MYPLYLKLTVIPPRQPFLAANKNRGNATETENLSNNAANELLEVLCSMHSIQSRINLEEIRKPVSQYIRFLPGPVTPQKYCGIDADVWIDPTLYGRILEEMIDKFDQDWPLNADGLDPPIKELIIVDGATVFILSESLKALIAALNRSEDTKKLHVISTILGDLLKSDAIFSCIVDTCRYGSQSLMEEEELNEAWRSALQILISLPSRVSNKLQFDTPKCYAPQVYAQALCFHVFRAISFVNEGLREFAIKPRVTALSSIISKIVISLKPTDFSCFADTIEQYCLENKKNERRLIESIFRELDPAAVEYVATLFLKRCDPKIGVRPIFGSLFTEPNWKYVLTTKVPLMRYHDDTKLPINLITYLSHYPDERGTLSELLIKLLELWSDGSILNHAPVEQRRYITQLIILSVKLCRDNSRLREQCQQLLLSGVSVHLECTNVYLRAMGMMTGEICVNTLSTADAPKLQFEYDNMPGRVSELLDSLKNLSTLELTVDVRERYEREGQLAIGNLIFDSLSSKRIYQLGVDCEILPKSEDISNVEDDVCLPRASETDDRSMKRNETRHGVTINSDDNSDLDSDDDLIPYDITDDTMKPNKLRPLYLRDVRDNLTDEEAIKNPDLFAESLLVCDDLIRTQLSNDDASFAVELLELLVTLRQESYVENFEGIIFRCCVRIVIVCPKEGAEYLCKEFYEDAGKYSLNQRLLILDILAESAKRLSKVDVDETSSASTGTVDKMRKKRQSSTRVSLLIDMKEHKKQEWYADDMDVDLEASQSPSENWREIIDKRIASQTRRFASESSNAPKLYANRFANVASSFFYPLLYGFDRRELYKFKTVKIYSDQMNILLLRYLKTLSAIMLAARNSALAPKMGKEILELTWTLRYHTEAPVRLAVVENVGSVLVTVPQGAVVDELLQPLLEIREWLVSSRNVIHGEHDANCRALNEKVLSLIDCIIGFSCKPV